MITVEADCYNCNSSESSPYAVENGFSLVKCAGCGLLYVTPRPSDDELAKSHECGVHQGDAELDMTGRFRDQLIPSYIEKAGSLIILVPPVAHQVPPPPRTHTHTRACEHTHKHTHRINHTQHLCSHPRMHRTLTARSAI